MRWIITLTLLVGLAAPAVAHHPDRANQPVHPRIDLIPPLGTNLPPSHRRVYNRPSYWAGKIAYWIAPSSQEAMAWHDAQHRRAYENHRPRIEMHYFYPKPWEVLKIGARMPSTPQDEGGYDAVEQLRDVELAPELDVPVPLAPLVEEDEMIEE